MAMEKFLGRAEAAYTQIESFKQFLGFMWKLERRKRFLKAGSWQGLRGTLLSSVSNQVAT